MRFPKKRTPKISRDSRSHYLQVVRASPSFAVALREVGEVASLELPNGLSAHARYHYADKRQAKFSGIFAAFCRQPRRKTWQRFALFLGNKLGLLGAVRLLGTHGQVVTPQNLDWRAASVNGMVRSRSPVELKMRI
jgi:hypothetical protein